MQTQFNDKAALEEEILSHHKTQLELCNRLEHLADNLPDGFDKQECLSLSWQLFPTVKQAHQFEEKHLFPLLLSGEVSGENIEKSLERLKFEHWEDESSAEDIGMFLKQLVQRPTEANVDKLSYMLRGFFEGLRRHIAFETEHLLPKLKEQ